GLARWRAYEVTRSTWISGEIEWEHCRCYNAPRRCTRWTAPRSSPRTLACNANVRCARHLSVLMYPDQSFSLSGIRTRIICEARSQSLSTETIYFTRRVRLESKSITPNF